MHHRSISFHLSVFVLPAIAAVCLWPSRSGNSFESTGRGEEFQRAGLDFDPEDPPRVDLKATSKVEADAMLQRQAACFVPNLGQWQHGARFVQRG